MRGIGRILLIAVLGLAGSACSVTRHIPEGQYFLQKIRIEDDKATPRQERIPASDLEKYVRQTPNKRFLGTNFYVWLYEQADPAKTNGWNDWKRRIGQAPVLLDMNLTERSVQNLKVYMDSKGFFTSRASCEVDTVSRRKRAILTFRTVQGEPYRIDSVSYEFQDNFLEQIVLPDTVNTLLHTGDIYDVSVLDAERERIAAFQEKCGEEFGENAVLNPENLIDPGKFQVKTEQITVSVDPEFSYLVETCMIDGKKYIMIPVGKGVEVNGLAVNVSATQTEELS